MFTDKKRVISVTEWPNGHLDHSGQRCLASGRSFTNVSDVALVHSWKGGRGGA